MAGEYDLAGNIQVIYHNSEVFKKEQLLLFGRFPVSLQRFFFLSRMDRFRRHQISPA